jgi:hypothetical protein
MKAIRERANAADVRPLIANVGGPSVFHSIRIDSRAEGSQLRCHYLREIRNRRRVISPSRIYRSSQCSNCKRYARGFVLIRDRTERYRAGTDDKKARHRTRLIICSGPFFIRSLYQERSFKLGVISSAGGLGVAQIHLRNSHGSVRLGVLRLETKETGNNCVHKSRL